jgi:hypothetical protein
MKLWFCRIFTAAFLEDDDTAGEAQNEYLMAEAMRKGAILAE